MKKQIHFCDQCGSSLPDNAKFCPYCGNAITETDGEEEVVLPVTRVPKDWNGESEKPKRAAEKKNKPGEEKKNDGSGCVNVGCGVLFGILILIAVLIFAIPKSSKSSEPSESTVITTAQELVLDKLKAPATAVFPSSFKEYSVSQSGSNWTVSGYVDAQNSFGATIRTKWTAKFAYGKTTGTVLNVTVTFD